MNDDLPPTADDSDESPTERPTVPRARTLGGVTGDRYRLGEVIGKGGMGDVVTAYDQLIGRDVAIKRLRGQAPDITLDRFMREASIQGRLEHPAIVPVHELGVDKAGVPFIVMKKLSGTTLGKILRNPDPEKYTRQRLLRAFVEICLAVEFSHSRGCIHRDLKPDNIVLGEFGEVYVIDWGVAKWVGQSDDAAATTSGESETATRDGMTIGTPGYMAPEQARGERDLDARCDVYGLGCVLFEILAGERLHPTGDSGLRSSIAGIDARPSLRSSAVDVPPELDAICIAATMVRREDRLATARELAVRVERFLDGDRDLALRRELARTHLDRAKSSTDRSVTMREAGRALALDPTLEEAAALVGRMMVEPPEVTPPEVERATRGYDAGVAKRALKTSRWASVGFVWILPALFSMLASHPGYAIALVAMPIASLFIAHQFRVDSSARMAAIVIGWSFYTALLAHTFSPIVFAPTFAAVTALLLAASPPQHRGRSAIAIGGSFAGAIILTWIAEGIGMIPATITATRGTLTITAPGLDIHPAITIATLVMWVLVAVPATAAIGHMRRRNELRLRHRLELQAWQLRQVFPVGWGT